MKPLMLAAVLLAAVVGSTAEDEPEIYRGVVVVPEKAGCEVEYSDVKADYNSDRHELLRLMGQAHGNRFYRPYTDKCAGSLKRMDVEHIVARSEAHASGLCKADAATRKAFAESMLNLTVADCHLNRCERGQKCGNDVAEWQPTHNKCWFAERTLEIRRVWGLTIDPTEKKAVKAILDECESTDPVRVPTMCEPLGAILDTSGSTQCKPREGS